MRSGAGRWVAFVALVVAVASAYFAFAPAGQSGRGLDRNISRLVTEYQAIEGKGKPARRAKEQMGRAQSDPSEESLLTAYRLVSKRIDGLDEGTRKSGAQAMLDKAVSMGSAEAHLLLGVALRDGALGVTDLDGALSHFKKASEQTEKGLTAGSPDLMYLRALQIAEGLGVPQDTKAAHDLAVRAAGVMTSWRLRLVTENALRGKPPFERRELEVAEKALDQRMESGELSAYFEGVDICSARRSSATATGISEAFTDGLFTECLIRRVRLAADRGHEEAKAVLGIALLRDKGQGAEALELMQGRESLINENGLILLGVLQVVQWSDEKVRLEGAKNIRAALSIKGDDGMGLPSARGEHAELLDELSVYAASDEGRSNAARLASALRLVAEATKSKESMARELRSRPVYSRTAALFESAASVEAVAAAKPQPPRPAESTSDNPWQVVSEKPVAAIDPEQQSKTGYVKGAPRLAGGGLSTFTVDNSQGGGDAIARLYLNGARPAVRSFFVKNGESFTVKSLAPGSYVLRYRYMGSEDTFEADKAFNVQQTETETGTRYSTVKVTLYKVAGGNLRTKKVDPEDF